MHSFVYGILSLAAIFTLSLAQLENTDLTAEHVTQSLITPVANLDGSGRGSPALDFGMSGESDAPSIGLDSDIVGIPQAVVVRPAVQGCSNGRLRRRGNGVFCSSTEAPTSSQQKNPQDGDEQRSNGEAGQQKQQNDPSSRQMFAPILEPTCPHGELAICAAPNLIANPLAPGTFTPIPWVGNNIPPTIAIEEYSRIWLAWDPCKTMNGEELFMCCKRVWPRYPGSEMWDATPDRAAFLERYYLIAYDCTPREIPAALP